MKRTPMPPRKKPLKAKRGLRAAPIAQGHPNPSKKPRKPLKARNASRAAKAWARAFLSLEFCAWSKEQPCVRCGASPSDVHHEPPRSRGGTWKNVSPVCPDCHTLGGDARHNVGPESFWTFGLTYEEANRRHHLAWLVHLDGYRDGLTQERGRP